MNYVIIYKVTFYIMSVPTSVYELYNVRSLPKKKQQQLRLVDAWTTTHACISVMERGFSSMIDVFNWYTY